MRTWKSRSIHVRCWQKLTQGTVSIVNYPLTLYILLWYQHIRTWGQIKWKVFVDSSNNRNHTKKQVVPTVKLSKEICFVYRVKIRVWLFKDQNIITAGFASLKPYNYNSKPLHIENQIMFCFLYFFSQTTNLPTWPFQFKLRLTFPPPVQHNCWVGGSQIWGYKTHSLILYQVREIKSKKRGKKTMNSCRGGGLNGNYFTGASI